MPTSTIYNAAQGRIPLSVNATRLAKMETACWGYVAGSGVIDRSLLAGTSDLTPIRRSASRWAWRHLEALEPWLKSAG